VEAARATGMSPVKLFRNHFVPNIKQQLLSIGVFGVAGAILTETGLSFLGIGVPADTKTWGQIMFEARQNYSAWWLVLFSGLAISLLLYSLYSLALREKQNQLH
jgi:peptide/nickel transport system permease protein